LLEFLVDLAGVFACFGELCSVGEGLAEGFPGVRDLAAGTVGVRDGGCLALFEAVKTVLQTGDQVDRVGLAQVGGAGHRRYRPLR